MAFLNGDGKIDKTTVKSSTDHLATAGKISNLNIESTKLAAEYATLTISSVISNCVVAFDDIYFASEPNNIQDVKFVKRQTHPYFYIAIPSQGDASSYAFTFKNVEFPKNAKVYYWYYGNSVPETDADGNPVSVIWYAWYVLNNGTKIINLIIRLFPMPILRQKTRQRLS
ncbi:MAG: hypothetical protein J1E58_08200 [Prevotella sp.]|nr:hypothetical protein [Prevotella sp.]